MHATFQRNRHRGGVALKGPGVQQTAAGRAKGYRLGQGGAPMKLAIGDAQYLWLLLALELGTLVALRNKFRRSHGG